MAIPLYHAVAAGAPDPLAIFTRAQAVWNARVRPPYETFTLPCDATFLADRCNAGVRVQFIIRLADGRAFAQTLSTDGRPGVVLLRGGYAYGPAGAPFGFFRRAPEPGAPSASAPPNLANDPIATIAVVQAVDRAYDITLTGTERIGERNCYHLRLRPLRDPTAYPLRDLWVDTATFDVVRLNYAQPFNDTTAIVTYDFAPVGPQGVWSIVHIAAQAGVHGLFATHVERVDESLENIEFPPSEPDDYFSGQRI
ncbi:MAG TPA: hypothetical protein VMA98_00265 [Candidatus Acidoferrales bacterium]|nr:hypothetical protein [Candidatus Acidoferrales bacterium]